MREHRTEPTTRTEPETLDDEEFADIQRDLCSSSREATLGVDPATGLDAFRAAIRSSHWRVDHRRLW